MPNSVVAYRVVLCCLILAALPTCTATEPTDTPTLSELTGPPASAPVYTDYADIAPLFHQQNDTTYLINLWATWCKPCLDELPLLAELAERNADKPFQLALLSLDDKPEAIARIPDYLKRLDINLPVAVLSTQDTTWGEQIDRVWNGSLPTTIVYRNQLKYVHRRNFTTYPALYETIRPLLAQD